MTERKILRITEPQGEPDIIECDGMAYVVRRTCRPVHFEGDTCAAIARTTWTNPATSAAREAR